MGFGALPGGIARDCGVTGPILQAWGIAEDSRVPEPYLFYDQVSFDVPTGENGDSFDRFNVLYRRIEQSLRIIEQIHDKMPAGPIILAKLPKTIKAPEGNYYLRTENSLGECGYYMVSTGDKRPWRM